jgi:TRAP-type transport system periplasmic protein
MKRLSLVPMIMVIVILLLAGCSQPGPTTSPSPAPASTPTPSTAAKQIELRLAHQNPPMSRVTNKFLNPWAKKVEEATGGKVKITVYPSESLVQATQSYAAVKSGLADITWTLMGYFPGQFNLSSVAELPFMVPASGKVDGRAASPAEISSLVFQQLVEQSPDIQKEFSDVKLLFLHMTDANFPLTTKKPVVSAADIKGMKIRELGGYKSELWKIFGGSPLLLGGPDIFDAAQKGVIDMTLLGWSPISSLKVYPAFRYWTDAPIHSATWMVIMNKDTWNNFPKDIQDQIMSVSGVKGAQFAATSGYGFDLKDEVLTQIQKEGLKFDRVELNAGELDNWKNTAGKELFGKWVNEMNGKGLPGQKVLDEAVRLLDKYK